MSKWKSVKVEMPKKSRLYLCRSESRIYLSRVYNGVWNSPEILKGEIITHWAKLPKFDEDLK